MKTFLNNLPILNNMELGEVKSLEHSVSSLEKTVSKSKIAKLEPDKVVEYQNFFTAYAVIRGVMERRVDEEDPTNRYGALTNEFKSTVKHVDMLDRGIRTKKFGPKTLDTFIKDKIKVILNYKSRETETNPKRLRKIKDKKYTRNGLRYKVNTYLQGIRKKSDYFSKLCEIGSSVRKELERVKEENAKQERLRPNFFAEIGAVYKIFSKDKR